MLSVVLLAGAESIASTKVSSIDVLLVKLTLLLLLPREPESFLLLLPVFVGVGGGGAAVL